MYVQNNCMHIHGAVMGQHPTPSRFTVSGAIERVKLSNNLLEYNHII